MFLQLQKLQNTAEVAFSYGVTPDTIRDHQNNHADELIENIHYIYEINPRFKTKLIKWTLEGVYMLGFFIKSKQAKTYRKKVAGFLRAVDEAQKVKHEQTCKELTNYINKLADQQAHALSQDKHHKNQINGYKSQISQHNAVILRQKSELAEKAIMAGYENLKTRV